MNLLIIQFFIFLIIILILFLSFKFDKSNIKVKDISLLGFLCVLTAILTKIIVIKIPPGQPMLVIGISLVFCIFIGLLYSPKLSVIAGLVIDIIGIVIAPLTGEASMPFLGYTLSSILACLIPSLIYRKVRKINDLGFSIFMSIILIVGYLLSVFYLFNSEEIKLDQNILILTINNKIIFSVILTVIILFIIFLNLYLSKKHYSQNIILSIPKLSFIIIICEIIIHIILGSLWVNTLYEIPMIILMIIRIIKSIIALPLYLILLVVILKVIPIKR